MRYSSGLPSCAVFALAFVAACGTDKASPTIAGPSMSVIVGSVQWHKRPAWTPPMFREPIQGVKVGDACTFPSYDDVYQKHGDLGLVATIGESNPETCAGVMYFGDWVKHLRRAEQAAELQGARTDTAVAVRPARFTNEACWYIGQAGTVRYRKWTQIDAFGIEWTNPPIDTLLFSGRIEYTGRMYDHAPQDSWCGDEEQVLAIRTVHRDWYAVTKPDSAMAAHQDWQIEQFNGWGASTHAHIGDAWATSIYVQRSCLSYFQGPQTISVSNSPYIRVSITHPYYDGGAGNGTPPADFYECGDHSLPVTIYTYQPSQVTSL